MSNLFNVCNRQTFCPTVDFCQCNDTTRQRVGLSVYKTQHCIQRSASVPFVFCFVFSLLRASTVGRAVKSEN
ncbi:hypothetical protein T08_16354 [Trichinella sp. T8]|nr:hypothetical protein T08_16354 [Trichinella sp. T8]